MKAFILLFCAFATANAQNVSSEVIPDNMKSNAYVVVRENTEDYTINSIDNIELKKTKVWTILKKEGDNQSQIVLHYDKNTKLNDIKVSIYNAAGKEIEKYTKKDFSDYSNTPSFALYDDNRVLLLKVNSNTYPYTIKLSYTENSSDTVFISDFIGIPAYHTAVESSVRKIENKSGIPLRTKVSNTALANVNATVNGNSYLYEYKNIPALEFEKYAPSSKYITPSVEFSLEKFSLAGKQGDIKDWDGFGKWYYSNLLVPQSMATPELKAEVAALNLSGTTEEKVKKIFQYMQDKNRYIAVAIGIGGWMPMTAEEVRKKRYGDCKALTNYMRTMLDVAGIPSHYALIYSDESSISFDPAFPKMGGNHAILYVPNGDKPIWLENTSQSIAFNHLSYSTTNRNVLAVSDKGTQIINTPILPAEKSKEQIRAKIKLNPDKSIQVTSAHQYTGGQYDFSSALVGLSKKEVEDYLKSYYGTLAFASMDVSNFKNDKDHAKITYDVQFTSNDYIKKLGEDYFFGVIPFTDFSMNTSEVERKLPFETSFAYQDDYEIEYEAPQGYKFSDLPSEKELKSEFGTYQISYKLEDSKLRVHRVLTINKGVYPKEKFAQYVDFRKKAMNQDNVKILVTKI